MSNTARIIEIAGKKWIAGMHWQSFEHKPNKSDITAEAEEIGMESNIDVELVAQRLHDQSIQVGFSERVDGYDKNAFSLAAAIADYRRQPWLGVYRIDEKTWWYIAVRDNQSILPDGDIIGSKEEVIEARERHSGFDDWNYVDGGIGDLEEILAAINPLKVRDLKAKPEWLYPAIGAGVALLVSAIAFGIWSHYKHMDELAAAKLARERAIAALAKQPPKEMPSPLLTMPMPNIVMNKCKEVVSKIPLSLHNWSYQSVTCSNSSADVYWKRGDMGSVANMPQGALDKEGNNVVQTIRFDIAQRGPENAIALNQEIVLLFAAFQKIGVKIDINPIQLPPVLPGEDQANKPRPKPSANFTTTMETNPFNLDWNSIPGLRLKSVLSTKDGWRVEGVIYGR